MENDSLTNGGFVLSLNSLDVFGKLNIDVLVDYPDAETLVVKTYEVVNSFGYVLYSRRELVRAFSVTVVRGSRLYWALQLKESLHLQ